MKLEHRIGQLLLIGIPGKQMDAPVRELLETIQPGGVLGVGKHFPGLGHSTVDSHAQLPIIERSRDEITKQDLLPYTELFSKINARLNAVIVGHGHYPAIDGPSALPASLSRNIVNG